MNTTQYIKLTHLHWLGRDTPSAAIHFAVGVFITIVAMAAVCGNVLVVFTCVRYKDLRTRSNLLIINLAIGDLLMCVIDFPLLAAASFTNQWSFGWTVCQMYAFFTAVAGLVTINTLAVIAADRYWAVVRRPNPGQRIPKCVTATAVLFVWTYSVFWALCPILGWGAYVLDGLGTTCTFDYLTRTWDNRSFVLGMVAGNFVLPFSVMIFSYTRIWMAVREVKSGLERTSSHVTIGHRRFSIDSISSGGSVKRHHDRHTHQASDVYNETSHIPRDLNYNESSNRTTSSNRSPYYKKQIWLKRNVNITTDIISNQQKDHYSKSIKSACLNNSQTFSHVKAKSDFSAADSRAYCSIFRANSDRNPVFFSNMNVTFVRHSGLCADVNSTEDLLRMNERKFGNGDDLSGPCHKGHFFTVRSVISGQLETTVFSKIRTRYYNAIGSKLFLKQHRYRLHCEHKTIKIIMFLLVAFTLSWTPYMVVSLIGLFGDQSKISYVTSAIPSLIAKTSIVFNPLLYSISHPKVRKRILKSLCRTSKKERTHPCCIRNQKFVSSVTANSHSF